MARRQRLHVKSRFAAPSAAAAADASGRSGRRRPEVAMNFQRAHCGANARNIFRAQPPRLQSLGGRGANCSLNRRAFCVRSNSAKRNYTLARLRLRHQRPPNKRRERECARKRAAESIQLCQCLGALLFPCAAAANRLVVVASRICGHC